MKLALSKLNSLWFNSRGDKFQFIEINYQNLKTSHLLGNIPVYFFYKWLISPAKWAIYK